MSRSTFQPHAEVLRGVFDLAGHGMYKPLAESILALDFPEDDAARIEELDAKANEGTLTTDEEAELEAYANIGDLWPIGSPRPAKFDSRKTNFS